MPPAPGPGGAGPGGQFGVTLSTPGDFTFTVTCGAARINGTSAVTMQGEFAVAACSVRLELKPTDLNWNLPVASVVVVRRSPAPRIETAALGTISPDVFRTTPLTPPYCPEGLRVRTIAGACVVVPGVSRTVVCVGVYRFA